MAPHAGVLNCNGAHRTYKVTGQVVTASVHRMLIWANTTKALFTICGKNRLHCWDIDDALKAQRSENDVNAHDGEVVTDLVFLRTRGCSRRRRWTKSQALGRGQPHAPRDALWPFLGRAVLVLRPGVTRERSL